MALLSSKSAETIVIHLKSVFARHGISDCVICNKVPFSSKYFIHFAKEWSFVIVTYSSHYAQSNGMTERAIQTMKHLSSKAELNRKDPYVALLDYHNSPGSEMT